MVKPYEYQKEGVLQLEAFNGRSLLADEMGLGKTCQALWFVKRYLKRNKRAGRKTRPAIVVCPACVKYKWEQEAKVHVKLPATILEGQKPKKTYGFKLNHDIIILNYDILVSWLPFLTKLKPATVILDECQNVKNLSAKRTKAALHLCAKAENVIALSGTPITNRPRELWTTLHAIRPDLFPNFRKFADRYCQPKMTPWGWTADGAANLGELHRILTKNLMIRRLKKHVMHELPATATHVVPIKLRSYKEYNEAERNFIKWLHKKDVVKAKRARKARALVRLGYLRRLVTQKKRQLIFDWIDNFLQSSTEKLVVFGHHKHLLQPLHEQYKKQSVLIDGSTSAIDRQRAQKRFKEDKKCRLFIGSMQACSVGIDLVSACNVVFVEMDWVPKVHEQAVARCHRIGQTLPVSVYYLVVQDTIEDKLAQIICRKNSVVNSAIDGKNVTGEPNIFDELTTYLERRKQ